MLTKLSTFSSHTSHGDPLVVPFLQGSSIRKLAGHMMPEVQDWLSTYRSDREHIPLLVNALGASDIWGVNSNGDWFGWPAISHRCSARCAATHPFDTFAGRPPGPYGYLTFLSAHPFVHHRNKDPNRALGRVALACLNPRMRRAELVVLLSRRLAEQHDGSNVVDRVDRGECPDTSMGARVPFDICLICGHKSRTRDDYCRCVKELGMGTVLPDGRIVGVDNPYPRFFDISFVFIGADPTSKVMAKLAAAGVPSVLAADEYYGLDKDANLLPAAVRGARAMAARLAPRVTPVLSQVAQGAAVGGSAGALSAAGGVAVAGVGRGLSNAAAQQAWKQHARTMMRPNPMHVAPLTGKSTQVGSYLSKSKALSLKQNKQKWMTNFSQGKPIDRTLDFAPSKPSVNFSPLQRKASFGRGLQTAGEFFKAADGSAVGAVPSVLAADEYYGCDDPASSEKTAASKAEDIGSAKPLRRPPVRDEAPLQGTYRWNGLPINVENARGTWRVGKGWATRMSADYGEIAGSRGADGDPVDVYVGPDEKAPNVYVVHQNHVSGPKAGEYDEDKVMLGYESAEAAKRAYLSHYDSEKFFRSVTEMPLKTFLQLVRTGEVTGEKIAMKRVNTRRLARGIAGLGLTALSGGGAHEGNKRRKKKKKEASITKRISPPRALGPVAHRLSETEGLLDSRTIDDLVGNADLPTALHGLASSGVGLKPSEFQRAVLVSLKRPDLADSLERSSMLFPKPEGRCPLFERFGLTDKSDMLAERLGKLDPGRSYLPPVLVRRRITIVVRPERAWKIDHAPLLTKIAGAYGWYRDELLKTASRSTLAFARNNPELMARTCCSGDVDAFGDEGQRIDVRPSAIPMALLLASLRHPAEDESDDRELMVRVRSVSPELPEIHNSSDVMSDPLFAQLVKLLFGA